MEAVAVAAAAPTAAPSQAPALDTQGTDGGQTQAPPADKHKLVVNGKELLLSLDEMKAHVQKGLAADERFKSASEMSKKAEELQKKLSGDLDKLTKGDLKFLEATIGKQKFRELTEDYLLTQIEDDSLTPEEREYRDLKQYKAERERAEAEGKEAAAKEKYNREVSYFSEQLDKDIGDTLKASGKPVTPRTVKRMAETMLAALDAQEGEFKPIAAKDFLDRTLKELETDVKDYLTNLSADQLEQVLPKEILDSLRKAHVEKAIAQNPAYQPRRQEDGKFVATRESNKHKSIDSWLKSKSF